jgi:hypothetical protein
MEEELYDPSEPWSTPRLPSSQPTVPSRQSSAAVPASASVVRSSSVVSCPSSSSTAQAASTLPTEEGDEVTERPTVAPAPPLAGASPRPASAAAVPTRVQCLCHADVRDKLPSRTDKQQYVRSASSPVRSVHDGNRPASGSRAEVIVLSVSSPPSAGPDSV